MVLGVWKTTWKSLPVNLPSDNISWILYTYNKLFLRFSQISVIAHLVLPAGWGSCLTRLAVFYPTALNGCWGIVFTHGVRMVGRAAGNRLSGLYLRNRKV